MVGRLVNAEGNEVKRKEGGLFLDMEFEAHAGRAPLTLETSKGNIVRIGGGASGMSVHKAEGIWPADTDCSTGIPGLYAGGNCAGGMYGDTYDAVTSGLTLSFAVSSGRIASEYALKYIGE